jgi:fructoselysine 6-phosphate deglycase
MASTSPREEIVEALQGAANVVREAAAAGRELSEKYDKVFFVSCGAPNRSMLTLEYWLQHYSSSLEVRRYFPAEFIAQAPVRLDDRTLVILGSKSGTTPETVEAATFMRDKPGYTVGFVQEATRPLALACDRVIAIGKPPQDIAGMTHTALGIAMLAFTAGLLAGRDNWSLEEKLLSSLEAMPQAVADAKIGNDARSSEEARLYKDDKVLYHVASGPMFNTAYVFGVCHIMETQRIHSFPLEAAEFFHGPFEVVDNTLPFILLLGEDPSRPLMERVERFIRKFTERVVVYDSKAFEMKGVAPEVRGMVAPYIVGSALDRLAEKFAVWHNLPLMGRRYMWQMDY